ncbi:F-box protein [Cardamine amara subsp. amara]|uniref:F-box protein n=1 Tax=Cardamine amara subsp. amara TaxID=228776 RepID=A0ABD0ZD31_CARAN
MGSGGGGGGLLGRGGEREEGVGEGGEGGAGLRGDRPITEAIGFHGCKTWDLPKTLASYIVPSHPTFKYSYVASSNGLIWINVFVTPYDHTCNIYKSFVGNPVLRQWVIIPPPPNTLVESHSTLNPFTAMVTGVDEDGIVSSFKLVRTCQRTCTSVIEPKESGIYVWRVYVYSSETGFWTCKRLLSSRPVDYFGSYSPVNLNGLLYLRERGYGSSKPGVLIAYDFYVPESDDQCLVIPLPGKDNIDAKRCLTTSGGDVIYIELLYRKLKIWRLLNSESESWQLLRKFHIFSFGRVDNCFPLAMNPFDTDIIYLWSQDYGYLLSGNLQSEEFFLHGESEDWIGSECCFRINTAGSEEHMEDNRDKTAVLMLSQFVLSRWMDSVPRPPNPS